MAYPSLPTTGVIGLGSPPLPAPPEAPSLAAISTPEGVLANRGEAVPQLIGEAIELVRTIARAVPNSSEEVGEIVSRLRGLLVKALGTRRSRRSGISQGAYQ